jgi:hypothetical protein
LDTVTTRLLHGFLFAAGSNISVTERNMSHGRDSLAWAIQGHLSA